MWLIILILSGYALVYSQNENLISYNEYRNQVNETAMYTLGGWALMNIGLSAALYGRADGSKKYFYQMNAAWNTINLTIAGFGLYSAIHADIQLSWAQSLNAQSKIEKILLFNAGLDVAYMMTGFYLRERSLRSENNRDRLKGYGNSLIFQGGFLFLFDLTVYYFQAKNQLPIADLISHVYFTNGGLGIYWTF